MKLDVTVEKDGYMADAAITVPVGSVSKQAEELMACAERAFHKAMLVARAGFRVFEIGKVVEREVRRSGFAVVRELGGHGIGRAIHEAPHVPNYPGSAGPPDHERGPGHHHRAHYFQRLGPGVYRPRWLDGPHHDHALSAHFEHTLVVTSGTPTLLTAG